MSDVTDFDVLYFKMENYGRGPSRVFSHKYSERWRRIEMYCPNCGKQNVWQEDSAGDYYVGEGYLCTACEHTWTIQGPSAIHENNEQDMQRLRAIRASVRVRDEVSGER